MQKERPDESITIGLDHSGLSLKKEIVRFLQEEKWEVMDVGPHGSNPVDYPDIAREVGAALEKEVEALGFYGQLLARPSSVTIREVLEKLKNEEYKHIRLIRRVLGNLNLGRATE